MSDVDDLVRWLGEQLDDDESAALGAKGDTDGRWTQDDGPPEDIVLCDKSGKLTMGQHRHIARHDPARVLREIDAKQQMLRALESAEVSLRNTVPGREPHELMTGSTNSLRAIVRMLATAYVDRPGYREAWRP